MEREYWTARWKEGRIGFHEGRPNALLERHAGELGAGSRVFVPLSGKSEDMPFLAARGHTIVGVEIEEAAIHAFFAGRALEPTVETRGPFTVHRAGPFELLHGDFFAVERADLEGATAIYDRAAVVALPTEMRTRYAARLRALFPAGTRMLVVSFVYPEGATEGPPFSVGEGELRRLYAGATLDLLGERPLTSGRLHDEGIGAAEQAWRVIF